MCRHARDLRARCSHTRLVWNDWRRTWKALRELPRDERYVPLCSTCHRYRDFRGTWHELPPAVLGCLTLDGPLQITHSLCPWCLSQVRVGDSL